MGATENDLNFYSHELRESELMKDLLDNGATWDDAYNKAHAQASKEYGHNPDGSDFYTDEALDAFDKQIKDEYK